MVTREATPAASDSSLKVTITSGYPSIIGYGGDASTSNITWAASDKMTFNGAAGGYGFDTTTPKAKLDVNTATADTAKFLLNLSKNSVVKASVDTSGNAIFNKVTVPAFLWEVKSTHLYSMASAAIDSTVATDLMDTTGVSTMTWIYKHIVSGVNTVNWKTNIIFGTQVPLSVTPDSLIVKFRSSVINSDSATVQWIVKAEDGTILLNTGYKTPTVANVWQRVAVGGITPMTENQQCAFECIVRTRYDATVDISGMFFK